MTAQISAYGRLVADLLGDNYPVRIATITLACL